MARRFRRLICDPGTGRRALAEVGLRMPSARAYTSMKEMTQRMS